MAQRKTVNVETLKDSHERMTIASLQNPLYIANPGEGKAFRNAINIMLESVLHETGNYRGFSYIGVWEVDDTARRYL